MNYIINPSWFYWLQVLSGINTFIVVMLAFITVGAVVAIVYAVGNYFSGVAYKDQKYEDGTPSDSDWRNYLLAKKVLKIIIPVMIVFIIAAIAIPSKETMISMMIAKYATKENLSMTVEGIKSAVDYIVNAMKEIKG